MNNTENRQLLCTFSTTKDFKQTTVGYIPHKWQYRFVVKIQKRNDNGELRTIQMIDFKNEADAIAEGEKLAREYKSAGIEDIFIKNDTLDSVNANFFTDIS